MSYKIAPTELMFILCLLQVIGGLHKHKILWISSLTCHVLEMVRLKYTVNRLLEIKQAVDHQRRFRVLEPKACVNIRKFRINRKKTRRGKRHKNQAIPRSVEFSNLIMVKLNTETRIKRPQRNIRITTLNAQSVKNKDQLIADYILNTKANYMVITETWLRDTDDIWTEGSDLNQNTLKIWKWNRTGGIGRRSCTSNSSTYKSEGGYFPHL